MVCHFSFTLTMKGLTNLSLIVYKLNVSDLSVTVLIGLMAAAAAAAVIGTCTSFLGALSCHNHDIYCIFRGHWAGL